MPALICGSLAFDTITTFPGRFAEQILPQQVHILNVSFLVPTLRREFGGCAGNIAYNLAQLGGEPLVMATLGADGGDYLQRLEGWGISTRYVRSIADSYTAQAIIITDADNNQITAFHPGAMQSAHLSTIAQDAAIRVAIVAPDGRDAMLQHADQLAQLGIPFVFDPGQGLPMFDGAELARFVAQADWLAVNDYEAKMLCDRTGQSLEALSRSGLRGIVVTLAAAGCELVGRRQLQTHRGRRSDCRARPDGLWRCLPRRTALWPRTRLGARALRKTRQPDRGPQGRKPGRAKPCPRSLGARSGR